MDNALYKQTTVRRGHVYRYYASPATPGMPTLLFLHGYPSTSYDWHRQVEYFQPLGYGILAPDCLGAGGTAKPLDDKEYRQTAMAEDIVDILKAEGVDKVVGISHDWYVILPMICRLRYSCTVAGAQYCNRACQCSTHTCSMASCGLRSPSWSL